MADITLKTIKLRRSKTAAYRPTDLAEGEPFVNLTDGIHRVGGIAVDLPLVAATTAEAVAGTGGKIVTPPGLAAAIMASLAALGLGTAATKNVGTGAGQVAAGDDARFSAGGNVTAANVLALDLQNPNRGSPAIRKMSAVLFARHDLRDYAQMDFTGQNDCAGPVFNAFRNSSSQGASEDRLFIPPGQIALGSTVDISTGANVQGAGPVFSRLQSGQSHRGTNFILGHTGIGFNSQGQYQTGEISNISTSRLQPDFAAAADGTAFTPIDAQWDFYLSSRQTLRRVHCLNPTRMICIANASYGQGNLFEITGEPLLEGIFIQNANDMIFANAWNLWPWWTLDSPSSKRDQVWKWKHNNATAIRLGRVDACQWANIFVIGYRQGMVLQNYVDPGTGAAARANDGRFTGNITNLALDASVFPFLCPADGVIANMGMGVNGGLLSAIAGTNIATDTACTITGSNNFISLEQFTAANAQKGHLVTRGNNNTIKFPDGAHVGYWNQSGGNLPALYKEGTGNRMIFGMPVTTFAGSPVTGGLTGSGCEVASFGTT